MNHYFVCELVKDTGKVNLTEAEARAGCTFKWLPMAQALDIFGSYEEYHKTNITAIKEVNDALYDLKMNTEKYEKDLDALSKEQTDYKFAQQKFNEGIISKLDLMQKNEVLLQYN